MLVQARALRALRTMIAALLACAFAAPVAAAHGDGDGHGDYLRPQAGPAPTMAVRAASANASVGGLPTQACGVGSHADDNAHASYPASMPQFKVVYAHPADRPNRLEQWKDALQANAAVIAGYLATQTHVAKTARFDLGTECGPLYLDIQTVSLPQAHGTYTDFQVLSEAVEAQVSTGGSRPRDYVILADGMGRCAPAPSLCQWGQGTVDNLPGDDTPGSDNPNNRPGRTAVIWAPDGTELPGASPYGWYPEMFLHEMTHNMGGVQPTAPHSTRPPGLSLLDAVMAGYGHCFDETDVMCYRDGPLAPLVKNVCPAPAAGFIAAAYDCGHDDYFDPSPAPGSYLDKHWNVYDSIFLAGCSELPAACAAPVGSSAGGDDGAAVVSSPLVALRPAIRGRPRVGSTLRVRVSGAPSGIPVRVRWQRRGASGWANVPGARGPRYRPARGDVGRRLRVAVAAAMGAGGQRAFSAPTVRVAGRRPQPR